MERTGTGREGGRRGVRVGGSLRSAPTCWRRCLVATMNMLAAVVLVWFGEPPRPHAQRSRWAPNPEPWIPKSLRGLLANILPLVIGPLSGEAHTS